MPNNSFWEFITAKFDTVFLTALIVVILYGLLTVASIVEKKDE